MKPLQALLLFPLLSAAAPLEDYAEPYRILQQASRALDPALAASAYASSAALIFEYPGVPREEFRGTEAIRASYVRSFGQVDAGTAMAVDFRFNGVGPSAEPHTGVFRLDATVKGRPITFYGRFTVKLVKQDGHWRFAEDRGT
ncbi:MAG TPA: hypothetical protein VFR36_05955, partial [Sphingomicrobium sp.]|nr:hypothetical protein [Sphingomicrobium sp.]